MLYRIDHSPTDRCVIFDIPPQFITMWDTDVVYQRMIELCFICYSQYGINWTRYIDTFLNQYITIEFGEEMSQGYDGIINDIISDTVETVRSKERYFTEAMRNVLGYFNPVLLEYIKVRCVSERPIIEIFIPATAICNFRGEHHVISNKSDRMRAINHL